MKTRNTVVPAGALLLLALAARSPAALCGDLSCVNWSTEARFNGVAYTHLVHLANGCKVDALCRISTDANPEPTEAEVKAGSQKTVVTLQASPAREFSAAVRCAKR